jgi:hypothetical protein
MAKNINEYVIENISKLLTPTKKQLLKFIIENQSCMVDDITMCGASTCLNILQHTDKDGWGSSNQCWYCMNVFCEHHIDNYLSQRCEECETKICTICVANDKRMCEECEEYEK